MLAFVREPVPVVEGLGHCSVENLDQLELLTQHSSRRPDSGSHKDSQDCGVDSVGDETAMPRGQLQAEVVVPAAQVLVVAGDAGALVAAVAAAAVGDSTRVFQVSRGQEIQEHLRGLGSQIAVSWVAAAEVVVAVAGGVYHIHSLVLAEEGVGARELASSGQLAQQQCEARGYHTLKKMGVLALELAQLAGKSREEILTIKSSLPSSTTIENLYRNLTVLLHLPA